MIIEIFIWWILVEILSFLSLPLMMRIFEKMEDRGYSASKLTGIAIVSYVSWIIGFGLGIGIFSIIISTILLAIASSFVFLKNREKIVEKLNSGKNLFIRIEIIFISLFIIFCFLRMQTPEINTLEKFMDLAFVNSIAGSESMPPLDPWFSGGTINYYYFGHFVTSVLSKISGFSAAISYNLMFAMYYALFCLMIFCIAFTMTKKFSIGILAIAVVAILGNSFGIIQLITFAFPQTASYIGDSLNLAYPVTCCWSQSSEFFENIRGFSIWPGTRIIPDTINEFPIASFLFGDLHSHYTGFSFLALFILAIVCFMKENKPDKILLLSTGFLLGITALFNIWYFAICSLVLLIAAMVKYRNIDALKIIVPVMVFSFIIITPMIITTSAPSKEISLSTQKTSVFHIILIFSLPIFSVAYFLANHGKRPDYRFLFFTILASSAIAFATGIHIALLFLPIAAVSVWILLHGNPGVEESLLLVMIISASLIVFSTDVLFFESRMNNIFKIYLGAWILYGISSAFIFSKAKSVVFRAAFAAIFAINLIIPMIVIANSIGIPNQKTMDGMLYLKIQDPGAYYSIQWLSGNANRNSIILESPGRAYTADSVISANTGLQTVIGWVNHEFLWRGVWYTERESDVNQIYNNTDNALALEKLKKYNVKYVYVGSAEREKYSSEGLNKFSTNDNNYKLVFDNGSKIFEVISFN